MLKKCLLACLLCYLPLSYAETCPSIEDIHHATLQGWKFYDSDDDKILSAKRETYFRNHIIAFALAEWSSKQHAIHCYYRDAEGSELEAYVAKDNFTPVDQHHFWYQVSGHLHCAASSEQCEFHQRLLKNTQLARK